MKEKINIAELLKDCPKGMELDCALYGNVTLVNVLSESEYPIKVITPNGFPAILTKYGQYAAIEEAKCVIFPKGKTTWDGFQRPFKDGDIVAIDSGGGAQVFIFKEYIDTKRNYAHCYVMLDDDGTIYLEGDNYYVERFATEEEKQKLFQAIKDNGSKWNSKTKTLERLIEPKFKVGDRIIQKNHISQSSIVTEIKDTHYILEGELALPFIFQDEYEIVPNKFDITTLKPFDKVLVRQNVSGKWGIEFFGFYDKGYYCTTGSCIYVQCIPYEGNEHLLGKTDDCDEFYKTWK